MPLIISNIITHAYSINSELFVWEISESLTELEKLYFDNGIVSKNYLDINLDKRKKHWLISRLILSDLFGEKITLSYDKYGAPFMDKKNEHAISISHSSNYLALLLSEKNYLIGVDIQAFNPKIEKIISKFMSENENTQWQSNLNQDYIHALWTIKEAVFKTFKHKQEFKKIEVLSKYPFKSGMVQVEVTRNTNKYRLLVCHKKCDNYYISKVIL